MDHTEDFVSHDGENNFDDVELVVMDFEYSVDEYESGLEPHVEFLINTNDQYLTTPVYDDPSFRYLKLDDLNAVELEVQNLDDVIKTQKRTDNENQQFIHKHFHHTVASFAPQQEAVSEIADGNDLKARFIRSLFHNNGVHDARESLTRVDCIFLACIACALVLGFALMYQLFCRPSQRPNTPTTSLIVRKKHQRRLKDLSTGDLIELLIYNSRTLNEAGGTLERQNRRSPSAVTQMQLTFNDICELSVILTQKIIESPEILESDHQSEILLHAIESLQESFKVSRFSSRSDSSYGDSHRQQRHHDVAFGTFSARITGAEGIEDRIERFQEHVQRQFAHEKLSRLKDGLMKLHYIDDKRFRDSILERIRRASVAKDVPVLLEGAAWLDEWAAEDSGCEQCAAAFAGVGIGTGVGTSIGAAAAFTGRRTASLALHRQVVHSALQDLYAAEDAVEERAHEQRLGTHIQDLVSTYQAMSSAGGSSMGTSPSGSGPHPFHPITESQLFASLQPDASPPPEPSAPPASLASSSFNAAEVPLVAYPSSLPPPPPLPPPPVPSPSLAAPAAPPAESPLIMALWRMEELKVRREAVAVQEQRKAERVAQRARAQQRARERVRAETSKRAREVRAAKLDLEALKEQRKAWSANDDLGNIAVEQELRRDFATAKQRQMRRDATIFTGVYLLAVLLYIAIATGYDPTRPSPGTYSLYEWILGLLGRACHFLSCAAEDSAAGVSVSEGGTGVLVDLSHSSRLPAPLSVTGGIGNIDPAAAAAVAGSAAAGAMHELYSTAAAGAGGANTSVDTAVRLSSEQAMKAYRQTYRSSTQYISHSLETLYVAAPSSEPSSMPSSIPSSPSPDASRKRNSRNDGTRSSYSYVLESLSSAFKSVAYVSSWTGLGSWLSLSHGSGVNLAEAGWCCFHVLFRCLPAAIVGKLLSSLGLRRFGVGVGWALWVGSFLDVFIQVALGPFLPLLIVGIVHWCLYHALAYFDANTLSWRCSADSYGTSASERQQQGCSRGRRRVDVRSVILYVLYPLLLLGGTAAAAFACSHFPAAAAAAHVAATAVDSTVCPATAYIAEDFVLLARGVRQDSGPGSLDGWDFHQGRYRPAQTSRTSMSYGYSLACRAEFGVWALVVACIELLERLSIYSFGY